MITSKPPKTCKPKVYNNSISKSRKLQYDEGKRRKRIINITVEQLRSVPDSNKLLLQRFIRHETIGLLKFIKDVERIVYKLRQKSIDNIQFQS